MHVLVSGCLCWGCLTRQDKTYERTDRQTRKQQNYNHGKTAILQA